MRSLSRSLHQLGLNLLFVPLAAFVAVWALLLAGADPSAGRVWVPVLLAQAAYGFHLRRNVFRERALPALLIHGAALVAAFAVTLFVAGQFLDSSWDGLYYHQMGILRLDRGWNPFVPVADPIRTFGDQGWLIVNMTKFTWFYQLAVFRLFGELELGKHLNLVLLLAAWCISAATLMDAGQLRARRALLVSAIICLNPIVTSQLLTFYVDGAMASLLVVFVALLFRGFNQPGRGQAAWVVAVFVLIMNTKLTGVVYAGVIGAGYLAWALYRRRGRLSRNWRWYAGRLGGAAVAGAILGYNPFITNLIQHRDPIKPLRDAVASSYHDPYKLQRPRNMAELSRLGRFTASVFSRTEAEGPPLDYRLKVPFAVDRLELRSASMLDCRIGGFGPWYSGALVLALALLFARRWRDEPSSRWVAAFFVVMLLSVLVNPESWWARFVPQAWLLPLIPLCFDRGRGPRWERGLRLALVAVLAVNAAVVSYQSIARQVLASGEMAGTIEQLKLLPGPVGIDFGPWEAARHRLALSGLEFVDLTGDPDRRCLPVVRVGSAQLRICAKGLY